MLINSTESKQTKNTSEMPACLCKQVMLFQPDKPQLRYSKKLDQYLMFCPTCGYRTRPDSNRQAVVANWYLGNRGGDKHIETLWIERYTEIQSEPIAQKISGQNEHGTAVPIE